MKNLKSLMMAFFAFALMFTSCKEDEVVEPQKNIVELAQANPDLSILVQAVLKANLAGALSGDGPLTVFAPTNAAFVSLLSELGAESLDDLDSTTVAHVLLYHVVGAKVLAGSLTEGQVVTTLFEDNTFTVGLVGGPKVTDLDGRVSNIKATDIEASNGVVHVVDKVFLPGILGTRE
ncbi:MAG: fasciclin domain-containing protein [Chitinophagales bacterium]|jgi:transforming growth factor-beta-induced protein|nr:fasciclin domain-containing protein [Chitinophagales bacterium]